MKTPASHRNRAFTLIETVIAIGVLAVLLTGFIIVFAPAAEANGEESFGDGCGTLAETCSTTSYAGW